MNDVTYSGRVLILKIVSKTVSVIIERANKEDEKRKGNFLSVWAFEFIKS